MTGNRTSASTGVMIHEYLTSEVALVRMGSAEEKVVTLTLERMESLREILQKVKQERAKGLIIMAAGPDMFTSGADINLIRDITSAADAEKIAKLGQSIFAEIENLPFPTIAAISGPCVGGGCELALACSMRIITDQKSSTIGLPETKLGILPGFGGTQRLPRLVGLPNALDIILAGKLLKPRNAKAIGLVDEIVPWAGLKDRAETMVIDSPLPNKRRLKLVDSILTYTGFGRNFVAKKARASVMKETRGFYPAPPAALDSALLGLEKGLERGYEHEARELGRLLAGSESKNLVRLFFLTESAKNLGRSGRKAVDHVQAVVIGAGVMGAGIAGALARAEASVILKDTTQDALDKGLKQIRSGLQKSRSMTEAERSFVVNRIEFTTKDSPNTGNANFAVEAIVENLEVKQKVLSELAKSMPMDAVIATNTSSLSVSAIAKAIPQPERVIGMHFFNPVEKMPLVEIVSGELTSDKAIAVTAALTTKIGKFPVVVKDVPGFLVNRILTPYLNEAAFLLAEGYSIKDIDDAATAFGLPMGPLRLLDEIGLDIAMHVSHQMIQGYGQRMKAPEFAAELASKGRKGKKSGAGFYDFSDKGAQPCANISSLLTFEKGAAPAPKSGNREDIAERLVLALVNEAVRCLDEGVAGAPGAEAADQVDLASVMGMGFPPFRGGIIHYAETLGAKKLYDRLSDLSKKCGERFLPTQGLALRASSGGSLRAKA